MADSDATEVFFAQGEQLVAVTRRAASGQADRRAAPGSIEDAVSALLRGPTAVEARAGITTHLPADTRLRGARVDGGIATVDLGAAILRGKDGDALTARLAQVVYSATAVAGVEAVRLHVNGSGPRADAFPGVNLKRPVTRALLEKPTPQPRSLAGTGTGAAPTPATRALQQRLLELGFLRTGGVDGIAGEETRFAVTAFQKWARLRRDGVANQATQLALAKAVRPTPLSRGSGRRIEVLLDRQLALLIDGTTVVRAIHVSTGKPSTPTPAGSYSVYRKERRSWSVPFRVWLPWASYFVGGIAFHEYHDVPARPASHGCVRVPRYDSKNVFDFAPIGTRVRVMATS
jgi:hypothetical protein